MTRFNGYQSAAKTHVGNTRRVNQDAFYDSSEKAIWCVADGMGGYRAGDIAAAMVVEAVANVLPTDVLGHTMDAIRHAVLSVNQQLIAARADDSEQMTGATVVALAIEHNECGCLWAGDSRFYLFRDGNLYLLSKDHSVVQEMVDQGIISWEEARFHPQSHVITRAVGVNEELTLDFIQLEVCGGDVLLLCSDGLYGELSADCMLAILQQSNDCGEMADNLINATLEGEAKDNVTVSIIQVMT